MSFKLEETTTDIIAAKKKSQELDYMFLNFLDNNTKTSKFFKKKKNYNSSPSKKHHNKKSYNKSGKNNSNNFYTPSLFRNYKKFFPYWYKYHFSSDKFKSYSDPYAAKLVFKFPYKRLKNFYWHVHSRYKKKSSKFFKSKLASPNNLEFRMNFFNTLFSSRGRTFRFSRKTFSFLNFFLLKLFRKYFFLIFKSKKLFSLKNTFKFITASKIIYSSLINITNSFVSGILKNKNLNMKLNKYFCINVNEPKLVTDVLNKFYSGFRDRGVRFGHRFSSHLRINESVFARFFLNLFFFLYLNNFKYTINNNNIKSSDYFSSLSKKKVTFLGPKFLKFFTNQYKIFNNIKLESFNNNKMKFNKWGYSGRFKNLLGSSLVFINNFVKDWWYEIEDFLQLDKINFKYGKIPYSYKTALTYRTKLIKKVKKFKKIKFRRKSNRLTFFFNKLVPKFKLTRKFKSYFISKIGSLKSYMRFNKLKNYYKQKMTLRRFLRKYYEVPDSIKMYNRVSYVSSRPNKWKAFMKVFIGRLLFAVYWLGYAKDLLMSRFMIMNGLIMVNGFVCLNLQHIINTSDFISLKWDVFLLDFKKKNLVFKKCFTRLMQIQLLKHLFFNHDYDIIMKRRSDVNVNPFLLDLFKKKNYSNIVNMQQKRNNFLLNNTKLYQVLNSTFFFLKYKNLIYIELMPQSINSFFNVFKKIENKYFNKKIFRKLAYRTYF